MTSRLKRKLDNIGIDASDSRVTESFCMIGTPLPPLEKTKDTGEFLPVWKQDVRDEQGRKRLHGAFTGGFSAGYFNTVGSKEGWTPQTFTSSRSSRAANKGARPEDFMDEEDLAEMRDSQKLVDTTEEMDLTGGTAAEMRKRAGPSSEKDSIAIALESLLPPARDSAGAQLLKKMGWRPGYGIGPRVTYRQLTLQDQQASSLVEAIEETKEDEDEEANKHLYAPRDTKLILFRAKDNAFGLGYIPGQRLDEASREEIRKDPNISAGFGLGALNDADEDDLDVYDGGFGGKGGRRLAYDAGEDEDDRITLGPSKRANENKPNEQGATGTAAPLFHDGRPVLAGFKISEKPIFEEKWFAVPEVPKNWTPDPQRVWSKSSQNESSALLPSRINPSSGPHSWKAHSMTADERGNVLGEARLPAAPRSVFDYLSQKDRDRLKNMAAGVTTPASAAPIVVKEEIAITIAPTDARTAQAALRGFQPFTADPVKQSRYTSYLLSQSKPTEFNPPELKMGQAIDDFNKELEDYAKAALIFKPVSGAMANRFTSATVMDLGPTVQEGLHTPMPTNMVPAAPEDKKEEPIETPKANAARLGMYGPLTREVEDWFPARLLCKRFGVKDPHPDGQAVDSSAPALDTSSAMAGIQFQSAPSASTSHAADQTLAIDSAVGLSTKPRNRKDISNIGLGDDDDQGRDTLTYERPDRDIFKAIFASDEEDSDEEDDQPDVKEDGKENEDAPLQQLVPSTSGSSLEVQRLNAEASTSIPYNPKATAPKVIDTSFRPTFVSKAEREGRGGRGKEKEAKDGSSTKRDNKSSKKKTGPSALVSFGMDVEEVDERIENGRKRAREKDKEKEKREKKKRKEEKVDDDEDMWVEKPPPPGLANIGNARHPNTSPEDPMDSSMGPARGRKRAVDFL